jgi:dsDNA-specific endonuclease/ATPase MutS2
MVDPPLDDEEEEASDGDEAPARAHQDDPVTLPIESVLDLHSFQPRDVASVVEEYLLAARKAGYQEVRIVHGRGIGVQREIVRTVLARTPFVLSFRDAPPGWGGWGATVAVLATEISGNR